MSNTDRDGGADETGAVRESMLYVLCVSCLGHEFTRHSTNAGTHASSSSTTPSAAGGPFAPSARSLPAAAVLLAL